MFACVSVIFSIVDFNILINPDPTRNTTALKFVNDGLPPWELEVWRRAVMTTSGVVSFAGVLGVVLVTKKKRSNYFWGFINSVFYSVFAFAYGYAGDFQLFAIYFTPLQIYGMYLWDGEAAINKEGSAVVKSLSLKQWIFYVTLCFLVGVAFYFEIPAFSRALTGYYVFDPEAVGTYAPLVLDSCSNAFNVVAQILMLWRYWEMWIFWILVDIVQIAMWTGVSTFPADFNITVMWTLFLVNACLGLYVWFTTYRRQQAEGREEDESSGENHTKQDEEVHKQGEADNRVEDEMNQTAGEDDLRKAQIAVV